MCRHIIHDLIFACHAQADEPLICQRPTWSTEAALDAIKKSGGMCATDDEYASLPALQAKLYLGST